MIIKKIRAISAIAEHSYPDNAEAVEELLVALRRVIWEEIKTGKCIGTVEIPDQAYNVLFQR